MNDIVNEAKEIACQSHAGQTDKAGYPYIEHVARVAEQVSCCPKVGPEGEAVAWLHDVAEDHPEYESYIFNQMPEIVSWGVTLLNRNRAQTEAAYYREIRGNTISLVVKLADIHDNMDAKRLAMLDVGTASRLHRKYSEALKTLGYYGCTG